MSIIVTPLDGPLGAQISGVDLSQPLGDDDFAIIQKALTDHLIFVISGLDADLDALAGFCRRFGPLVPHVLEQYHHPETSDVSIISTNPETGAGRSTDMPAGAFWHSDLSYDANPSDATMLYGVEIPPEGGDTLFSNMVLAYDSLPHSTQNRIEGLNAVHRYGYRGGSAVVDLNDTQGTRHPDVIHPMVRPHPLSGKKALFVNPGFTVAIEGLSEEESRDLLNELFEHATEPDLIYRHAWKPGQLVASDNRTTIHCATAGYEGHARTLWRFIVGGTG
ncbi:MAG: TauD/TfdA family dioxygenase [Proteobacteria bacterium]|nr:TauD/TfdA family dioxygenase [Pseudomonadota bacterium]MDA1023370.1 TauD/TfdA family dioxygenase [Pseudomonadota bacterium]